MKTSIFSALSALLIVASVGASVGPAFGQQDLKQDAKKVIAPQSIRLQSSLLSAKANLEGLKTQLQSVDFSRPDATFLNQVKSYDHSMDSTIRTAAEQETKLKSTINESYPQFASTDDLKSLDFSVSDLQAYFKSWSAKTSDRNYWLDKDQVRADMDSLSKRLDKAIDQSKTFNASKLDISFA